VALIFSLSLINQAQNYLSRATGAQAKIKVDTAVNLGPIDPHWQALAQGGEENKDMLADIIPQVSRLKPRYIRLDHIFDAYDLVARENGRLVFNWSKLDSAVDSILKTGALPFLSLSYMPPAIAQGNQVTNPPVDWADWQAIVKATIEHFSGRDNRNLNNVYYEVWNEPDLFGNWRLGGQKDYRNLYRHAVYGAQQAQNVNSFKIGGPATTAPYENWLNDFLEFTSREKLRLDFYSWHRYCLGPAVFIDDVDRNDNWLIGHGGHYLLPKIVSEWGSISENSPYHDSFYDAAHLVATIRQLIQRVDFAFIFEIKDGPSPESQPYWGRWGLLTHQGQEKPKYQAINLVNQVSGNRLKLTGEGDWVTGFAATDNRAIRLVLTNLDINQHHSEEVPVTFVNLKGKFYQWEEIPLRGKGQVKTLPTGLGLISQKVILAPNQVMLIKLTEADQTLP
jgi:xylan 1,4-beta-xylosidase